MLSSGIIQKVQDFVKEEFVKHPHYSFGHWSYMVDHSVRVKDIALTIAGQVECDRNLVAIISLLHDIGKTKEEDPEVLLTDHENFNWEVSESFLRHLDLSEPELEVIKDAITYHSESVELKIVKDADTIAMYSDAKLRKAYIAWAFRENKLDQLERKIHKFDKLNFAISREMGKEPLEQMKADIETIKQNFPS